MSISNSSILFLALIITAFSQCSYGCNDCLGSTC